MARIPGRNGPRAAFRRFLRHQAKSQIGGDMRIRQAMGPSESTERCHREEAPSEVTGRGTWRSHRARHLAKSPGEVTGQGTGRRHRLKSQGGGPSEVTGRKHRLKAPAVVTGRRHQSEAPCKGAEWRHRAAASQTALGNARTRLSPSRSSLLFKRRRYARPPPGSTRPPTVRDFERCHKIDFGHQADQIVGSATTWPPSEARCPLTRKSSVSSDFRIHPP